MQPGSVSYSTLVDQLKASFTGNSLSQNQQSAITAFDLVKYNGEQPNGMPTLECIRQYAHIFDQYFFQGLIFGSGRCWVAWGYGMFRTRSSLGNTRGISGCKVHKQIHATHIQLEPEPVHFRYTDSDIEDQINGMLATLLHEICHAVLLLYGCKCHSSLSAFLHYFGMTGHGVAFQRLYLAVMAKANVEFDLDYDQYDWEQQGYREERKIEEVYPRGGGNNYDWLMWRSEEYLDC